MAAEDDKTKRAIVVRSETALGPAEIQPSASAAAKPGRRADRKGRVRALTQASSRATTIELQTVRVALKNRPRPRKPKVVVSRRPAYGSIVAAIVVIAKSTRDVVAGQFVWIDIVLYVLGGMILWQALENIWRAHEIEEAEKDRQAEEKDESGDALNAHAIDIVTIQIEEIEAQA